MSNEAFDLISEIINHLLKALIFSAFLGSFTRPRTAKRLPGLILMAAAWFGVLRFISVLSPAEYSVELVLIRQGVLLFLAILLIRLFFQGNWSDTAFWGITYLSVSEIALIMSTILMNPINGYLASIGQRLNTGELSISAYEERVNALYKGQMIGYYGIGLAVLAISLFLITKVYKEKDRSLAGSELIFLIVPELTGWIAALMLHAIMFYANDDGYMVTLYERYPIMEIFLPLVLALLLASIILAVFLFQKMLLVFRERNEKIFLEREVELLKEHIDEIGRLNTNVRAMRHDMKNHISVISGLSADVEGHSELHEYINRLAEEANQSDIEIKSGDAVVDILLSMKKREAEQRIPDIRFEASDIRLPERLLVKSYDLSILLGNAIDNAIEACETRTLEEPYISISGWEQNHFLIFEVKNSFRGALHQEKGKPYPVTDKEHPELHGIGYSNMKRVTDQYSGTLDWEIRDGSFIWTAMLRNKEQN